MGPPDDPSLTPADDSMGISEMVLMALSVARANFKVADLFPLKPMPSAVQTARTVLWIGAQRQSGKMRWIRSGTGTDQLQCLRNGETWLQNINFPMETDICKVRRRFGHPGEHFEEKRQARERPTTPLQSDLGQETCPTPPPGQTEKKCECCEEGRAPPAKP